MKSTLRIIIVLISLHTFGCQATPKSFEQGLQLIQKASDLAEKQGVSYHSTLRWNGKVAGSYIQRLEGDSGVTVEVHFQGNAAAQRASVTP